MDEDTDLTNWVLVDETDCKEKAVTSNPPITSVPAASDSDQESDGSISIISDHPTDTNSEEETEPNFSITHKSMPIIKIDTEFEAEVNEEIKPLEKCESKTELKDNAEKVHSDHETRNDEPTTLALNGQWTYVDDKSILEQEMPKQKFFLDCSQEPILEVTPNNTDVDTTESTTSSIDNQAIVKKESTFLSSILDGDSYIQRQLDRLQFVLLVLFLLLASSSMIIDYLDSNYDNVYTTDSSFMNSLVDNEKARPVLDFCIDKHKESDDKYVDQAVEKCVMKRLRKKNREEAMKKTEIYLQMKERILELKEKELAEKEREIVKKWRKRNYIDNDIEEDKKKGKYDKKHKDNSKEFDKKFKKRSEYKKKSIHEQQDDSSKENQKIWKSEDIKGEIKTFQKKGSWTKDSTYHNYEKQSKESFSDKTKYKKHTKDKEDILKGLKDQVKKDFHKKDKSKQKLKDLKGDRKEDPNEEWFIKYNPIKNTIELINITTLPEQDSLLIRNGNKTINGQWYFSLYGSSRSNIRNKEKAAEWYFKRGHLRENKRDKAKWYFEYMSAHDNNRYFY